MAVAGSASDGRRPVGAGGWAGAFNTYFWIDRANGLAALFFTQTLPFYDPTVVRAYDAFEHAVYGTFRTR